MTDTRALMDSLRANADLTEKALDFMSDPEQIEESKTDIALWRDAADEIERLTKALTEIRSRRLRALATSRWRLSVGDALWDSRFRERMLRHGLSNAEIAQAVEAAEAADRKREELQVALQAVVDFNGGNWLGRQPKDIAEKVRRALR